MTHQLFFLWNGSMAKYTNNDAFPIRTSDFLKSLRERPGTTISRRIEITDLRDHNAGRETGSWPSSEPIDSILAEDSAVAVENVKEDEDLCFRWLWEVGCRVSYLFRAVSTRAVLNWSRKTIQRSEIFLGPVSRSYMIPKESCWLRIREVKWTSRP